MQASRPSPEEATYAVGQLLLTPAWICPVASMFRSELHLLMDYLISRAQDRALAAAIMVSLIDLAELAQHLQQCVCPLCVHSLTTFTLHDWMQQPQDLLRQSAFQGVSCGLISHSAFIARLKPPPPPPPPRVPAPGAGQGRAAALALEGGGAVGASYCTLVVLGLCQKLVTS